MQIETRHEVWDAEQDQKPGHPHWLLGVLAGTDLSPLRPSVGVGGVAWDGCWKHQRREA